MAKTTKDPVNADRGGPDRVTLSVIMPAYNEVLTIKKILRRVAQVPIDKQIIVVDDGSTDGTRAVLASLQENWPEGGSSRSTLEVVLQPQNGGKGKALRTGIAHAKGRVTLIQDADLEYDPNDYPKLVEPILSDRADVVYGSRFVGTPRRVLFFWHSIGNRFLTTLSNALTDLNLTDMETCYKAFRTEIIQSIPLREDRFGFEPEVTMKVARLGLRIYEVPISYDGRAYADGKKIGWRDGVEAVSVLLRNWARNDTSDSTVGRRSLQFLRRTGKYNDWLFKRLQVHLGHRVIEIGASIGNLSNKMLDREHLCVTDVSSDLLEPLRQRFADFDHVTVTEFDVAGPPSDAVRAVRADTAICCNVLQHLDDDDLALTNIRDALKPNGRLVLLVPAHQFAFGTLDEQSDHLRRYERQGLTDLLGRNGWELEAMESLNALGLAGWAANSRVLQRQDIPRNQIALFDHLVPVLDLERRFNVPFGLSVLAVARRR